MNRPMMYNGWRVNIAHPIESKRQRKRTFWERLWSLTPHKSHREEKYWCDYLEPGQVIVDKVEHTFTMTEATWKQLEQTNA